MFFIRLQLNFIIIAETKLLKMLKNHEQERRHFNSSATEGELSSNLQASTEAKSLKHRNNKGYVEHVDK